MDFYNIQMAVVRRTEDGKKIDISEINENNRYEQYECIMCGSNVVPVVPNGKTVDGEKSKITPHFKHLDISKCNSESFVHFCAKTEFLSIGSKFKVMTDKEEEYICNQIFFEKTIDIGDKKYKPDATVYTSCGKTIHFEINYTNNKKIKDYIDKWEKLNHIIVEVNINIMSSIFSNEIPVFKAIYYQGKCFNLNSEDKLYIDIIGKYKITKEDKKVLEERKIEIEKLDWLWDEIRKVNNDNFETIGKLLQSIESEDSKEIAINLLKKSKCNNILDKYVTFLKDKIDRRLKLLNLKHNGYLVKYETKIPRKIYDRIFSGIIIELYPYNSEDPEICQTNQYNFNDDVLSDDFKRLNNYYISELSSTHRLIEHIIKVLNLNNKILDYKYCYEENTDYIKAVFFKDYRCKNFVFYNNKCSDETDREYLKNIFSNIIDNDVVFLNNYFYKDSCYIKEEKDSYCFLNYIPSKYKYKFSKIFKQDNVNLTYKFLKTFEYKSLYDFVKAIDKLKILQREIISFEDDYNLKEEHLLKIYYEPHLSNDIKDIYSEEINNKIYKILYPLIYESNKTKSNDLNITLSKEFTKDSNGKLRPWLIKDFINFLDYFGEKNINNIK